jgi:hypothetical protein
MNDEAKEFQTKPFRSSWMIWTNPIVRRYARSRLRFTGLGISVLLMTLVSAFVFFVARGGGVNFLNVKEDVARLPLIPLLIVQGIVLFGLGTGQVAGAMTSEAGEKQLDYQRLAPMKPLAKVLGYLFGLPVREWVLFLSSMPFTIISLVQGNVDPYYALQLYAVFIVAGVLYHLTGLVTGTVMENRRWAFLSSMGIVFLLYTVIPQAAQFGLVYFKYLTIYPVVTDVMPHLAPRMMGRFAQQFQEIAPQAKFFGLDLEQFIVTLISQGVLCLTMIVMLWRHWCRAESHLLGKLGALGLFLWLQIVLLGNALPLIENGEIFTSREIEQRLNSRLGPVFHGWKPYIWEATLMVGFYGLVTLVFLWTMALIISPNQDTQLRGWRRARKLGDSSLPSLSDPSTSFIWVTLMSFVGVGGWYLFARGLIGSHWFAGNSLSSMTIVAMLLTLLSGGWALQAILETKGRKAAGLVAIFAGIVPAMVAVILIVGGDLMTQAVWIAGVCPALWPLFGAGAFIVDGGLPKEVASSIPPAFWVWQSIAFVVTVLLLVKLRRSRAKISKSSVNS